MRYNRNIFVKLEISKSEKLCENGNKVQTNLQSV